MLLGILLFRLPCCFWASLQLLASWLLKASLLLLASSLLLAALLLLAVLLLLASQNDAGISVGDGPSVPAVAVAGILTIFFCLEPFCC
jgi:hypothetical protein